MKITVLKMFYKETKIFSVSVTTLLRNKRHEQGLISFCQRDIYYRFFNFAQDKPDSIQYHIFYTLQTDVVLVKNATHRSKCAINVTKTMQ